MANWWAWYSLYQFSNVYHDSFAACPEGTFGQDCDQVCLCGKNTICNTVTGECECKPGYRGHKCTKGKCNF